MAPFLPTTAETPRASGAPRGRQTTINDPAEHLRKQGWREVSRQVSCAALLARPRALTGLQQLWRAHHHGESQPLADITRPMRKSRPGDNTPGDVCDMPSSKRKWGLWLFGGPHDDAPSRRDVYPFKRLRPTPFASGVQLRPTVVYGRDAPMLPGPHGTGALASIGR
jgi:hypothetical protein